MKTVFVVLLTVAAALAIPIDEDKQSGEGGWYVPQADGSLEWMTEIEVEALRQTPSSRASAVVYFYLYTAENPTEADVLVSDDVESLTTSHFNPSNPTRIVIHGWQSNSDSDLNELIREAYLSTGDYNVIIVDWSDKASSFNYAAAVLRVVGVGKQVAGLIDSLYTNVGLSFNTLELIGHSLGAHVAGHAGKNVLNGRINQITGLDPALPLYSYDSPADRLNQNDALYVESIQTNGGLLGFLKPIGTNAFYPNGGKSQPGCGIDLVGSCAHSRSYIYYAEAIVNNNYPSVKCDSYESAVGKSCGSTYSSTRLGATSNFATTGGHYYVPVNKKAPYGMGS